MEFIRTRIYENEFQLNKHFINNWIIIGLLKDNYWSVEQIWYVKTSGDKNYIINSKL